jgi:hypothetical protein
MRRDRTVLSNLLLAGASLLACAGLLEIGARLYLRLTTPRAPQIPLSRYHPILGWEKTPLAEARITRSEYDIDLKINSHGLRGPDRAYDKPSGTRRVLILGDSFAEGYYVAEAASVRALLERALNEACGGSEVLNGATAGYSTDQEYLFYLSEGHRYQPDLVVVFFFSNDLPDNTTTAGTGGKGKPLFTLDHGRLALKNTPVPKPPGSPFREEGPPGPKPWHGSMALRLLSNRTAEGNPALHAFLSRLGLVEPPSHYPPRDFWGFTTDHPREVEEMWRRTTAILAALKEAVVSSGGRLAILYVPIRFEVSDSAWEQTLKRYPQNRWARNKVFDDLKAAADGLGIPLVDPREALKRGEGSGYFPRDGHWNEVGNAAASAAILPLVQQLLTCPGRP